MGATRKLQAEIDRTLKKVLEGIDLFDDIWNKVYDTENANQKEKFEADLKKEIKKLQRYRDQIKTWISSSDIKDKEQLTVARKNIEREMERFKVCEKETKTKAFSKEGLGQAAKLDPREKAKGEMREWLNDTVDKMNVQIDEFESEIEGLQNAKRKQKPPPRLVHLEESVSRHKAHVLRLEQGLRLLDNDAVSPDQIGEIKDMIEDYLERNQEDFTEFETPDDIYGAVEGLMEMLEGLLETTLPGAPGAPGVPGVPGASPVAAPPGTVPLSVPSKPKEIIREKDKEPPRVIVKEKVSSYSALASSSGLRSVPEEDDKRLGTAPGSGEISPAAPSGPPPGTPRSQLTMALSAAREASPAAAAPLQAAKEISGLPSGPPSLPVTPVRPAAPATFPAFSQPSMASALGASPAARPVESAFASGVLGSPAPPAFEDAQRTLSSGPGGLPPGMPSGRLFSPAPLPGPLPSMAPQWTPRAPDLSAFPQLGQPAQQLQQQQQQQQPKPEQKRLLSRLPAAQEGTGEGQAQSLGSMPPQLSNPPPSQQPLLSPAQSTPVAGLGQVMGGRPQEGGPSAAELQQRKPPMERSASMPHPELGDGPGRGPEGLGAFGDAGKGPAAASHLAEINKMASEVLGTAAAQRPDGASPALPLASPAQNLQILQACAARSIPQPADSQWRPTSAVARPVAGIPPSYPQHKLSILDNPMLFERLDTEALFFSFYYQPGSFQQYLAARELKRQSWRYHKHHGAWFQRHEEPKSATDEYEQGTYVYFDYNIMHDDLQSGWCYRLKQDFTFKYDALEDELQI